MARFLQTKFSGKDALVNVDSIGYVTFDGTKLDVHLVDDFDLPLASLTKEEAKHLYDEIKRAYS
jgi:hypothetical protein